MCSNICSLLYYVVHAHVLVCGVKEVNSREKPVLSCFWNPFPAYFQAVP